MGRTLFPMLDTAPASISAPSSSLPLAKECAWDFVADCPIFRNGLPVAVTGAEAVKVWAFNALHTVRYRHEIWSFQYGCEMDRLIGQSFALETKKAEAARYITECLTASPYVSEVSVLSLELSGDVLTAEILLKTIYGEEKIHV